MRRPGLAHVPVRCAGSTVARSLAANVVAALRPGRPQDGKMPPDVLQPQRRCGGGRHCVSTSLANTRQNNPCRRGAPPPGTPCFFPSRNHASRSSLSFFLFHSNVDVFTLAHAQTPDCRHPALSSLVSIYTWQDVGVSGRVWRVCFFSVVTATKETRFRSLVVSIKKGRALKLLRKGVRFCVVQADGTCVAPPVFDRWRGSGCRVWGARTRGQARPWCKGGGVATGREGERVVWILGDQSSFLAGLVLMMAISASREPAAMRQNLRQTPRAQDRARPRCRVGSGGLPVRASGETAGCPRHAARGQALPRCGAGTWLAVWSPPTRTRTRTGRTDPPWPGPPCSSLPAWRRQARRSRGGPCLGGCHEFSCCVPGSCLLVPLPTRRTLPPHERTCACVCERACVSVADADASITGTCAVVRRRCRCEHHGHMRSGAALQLRRRREHHGYMRSGAALQLRTAMGAHHRQ